MDEPMAFGELLKRFRKRRGLSQQDLARVVGVALSTLQSYEQDRRRVPADIAKELAEKLALSDRERAEFLAVSGAWVESNLLPRLPLPAATNEFIGRTRELPALTQLLAQERVRLLTLVGPPGVGKTRLALQVATAVVDSFANGGTFVRLAALTDPRRVGSTIGAQLGVRESRPGSLAADLVAAIGARELLLVLDNFEHLLAAAPLISQLLEACAQLQVLATSRTPLPLYGEQEYPVPPLALPDSQTWHSVEELMAVEAVRLFTVRAQAVKPDFTLTPANGASVIEICRRLDGLPLAIELAAARSRQYTPGKILQLLDQHQPLTWLTGGPLDRPERQQTLRKSIDWSYVLLSEGHKQLFWRMAVFQGGCPLQALEEVCNYDGQLQVEVLDSGVKTLLDSSLLSVQEGSQQGEGRDRDGEARYWLLETIHEYAREKLEESRERVALQREHARYFMRLAEEAEAHLVGAQQQDWLERLEEEHHNIRAALQWARENSNPEDLETGLRTAGAIWRFWHVRGYYSEGWEWLGGLLALSALGGLPGLPGLPGLAEPEGLKESGGMKGSLGGRTGQAQPPAQSRLRAYRAKALNGAGALAYAQGDLSTAHSLFGESLAIRRELGDKWGIATSLNNLGLVARAQGDLFTARSLYEESLALKRELGDKWGIATSLNNLGMVAQEQGDLSTARSLYEESLALKRDLGDKVGIATSLNNVGLVAQEQGDHSTARALHEESLTLKREIGDKGGIAYSLGNVGLVAQEQGDLATARALLEESLALRREIGDKRGIAIALAGLGGVAVAVALAAAAAGAKAGPDREGVERGARMLGAVEAMLESLGAVLDVEDRLVYERAVAAARAQLEEEAFARIWQEGKAMSMEQAVEYALQEGEISQQGGNRKTVTSGFVNRLV